MIMSQPSDLLSVRVVWRLCCFVCLHVAVSGLCVLLFVHLRQTTHLFCMFCVCCPGLFVVSFVVVCWHWRCHLNISRFRSNHIFMFSTVP